MSDDRHGPSYSFGPEYPSALTDSDGTLMPLVRERRWSRVFQHPTTRACFWIPRFKDGSATISVEQVRAEWATWTDSDRLDFCQAVAWFPDSAARPELLRFLMKEGAPREWNAIALQIASNLPAEEAVAFFRPLLDSSEPGAALNILHGLARTRHPCAEEVIRAELGRVLAHHDVWLRTVHINRLGYAAICAIKYLLDLGLPPAEFERTARALATHADPATRRSFHGNLGASYPDLVRLDPGVN